MTTEIRETKLPDQEDIETSDPLYLLKKEAAGIPLLSKEQEQELLWRVVPYQEIWNRTEKEIRGKSKFKPDPGIVMEAVKTQAEQNPELKEIVQQGESSINSLIEGNVRWLIKGASRFTSKTELLDLVNEGALGLRIGALKNNPKLGFRFLTHANSRARKARNDYIAANSGPLPVDQQIEYRIKRYARLRATLKDVHGRNLSAEELSENIGETVEMVNIFDVYLSLSMTPLQTPINPDSGDLTLEDVVAAKQPSVEEIAEKNENKEVIYRALQQLTERERTILVLRYGFYDGKARTLDETGTELGISKERVRQIEKEAKVKLSSNPSFIKHFKKS